MLFPVPWSDEAVTDKFSDMDQFIVSANVMRYLWWMAYAMGSAVDVWPNPSHSRFLLINQIVVAD